MAQLDTPSTTDPIPVNSAARRFKVGARKLHAAIQAGEIPAYAAGRGTWRRVFPADVIAWIRSHRVTVTPRSAAHAEARVAEILQRESAREHAP